jgi:hypothetical protein
VASAALLDVLLVTQKNVGGVFQVTCTMEPTVYLAQLTAIHVLVQYVDAISDTT